MGLGPNGASLLDRTGQPAQVWRDPFAMQLEQQDRREARQEKAIWHAMHRAQPRKPEAPVVVIKKAKGEVRCWMWEGEDIPSKPLYKGTVYTSEQIRKAGFKLPKVGAKK